MKKELIWKRPHLFDCLVSLSFDNYSSVRVLNFQNGMQVLALRLLILEQIKLHLKLFFKIDSSFPEKNKFICCIGRNFL